MDWLGDLWNWFHPNPVPAPPTPTPKPVPDETFVQELLDAHNKQRSASYPLALNDKLGKAAQLHAQWMADHHNMSHNEGWATVADRAKAAGYNWNYVGENIAMGYADVNAVMSGWMKSPGHRANILNYNYKDVGFGKAVASDGSIYWCTDFGRQMP